MTADSPQPTRADATVQSNRCEGGANWRLQLALADWPGFAPGQFVMLSPGARSAAERFDPLLPRPMAVFRATLAASGEARLDILYKVTGRGTRLLAEARPGERVRLVGPLGRPFPEPPSGGALLVGGGTGIASLFELAARAAAPERVRVLLGARSAGDVMGRADFEGLGVGLELATEDGSAGRRGLVTELLEAALREDGTAPVYACGPTPMMQCCAELAAAAGRRCFVSLENTMACGFGVCLGCAVPRRADGFALVCRDGPVFEAAAIAWEGLA